jgi:hypothetical protein
MELGAKINQHYKVECLDKDGNLKWTEEFDNLVVTEGMNAYLTNTLKTIPGSIAWYVGLKGTGSVVAGDTLASHAGWSEINPYAGNRPPWTPGTVAAGSVDNSLSKASYTITSALTVYGAFMASVNTGTGGTLLGGGDFGTARVVAINDVLNVTVTCSFS